MKRSLQVLAIIVLLSSCNDDRKSQEPTPTSEQPTAEQYQGLAAQAITRINNACPGLKKNWPGVTTAGVSGNAKDGFEIQYVVNDSSKIARELKVYNGENCYFRTDGPLGTQVWTGKSACISLCTEEPYSDEATTDHKIQ